MWRNIWRSWRRGYIGDVAIYKSIAMGLRAQPSVQAALLTLDEPVVNLPSTLLPDDVHSTTGNLSLAQAYRAFLAQHKLALILVSDDLRAQLKEDDYLAARYAVLHDLFHVILGFPATPAGELGVYAFIHQQQYSKQLSRAYKVARVYYRVLHWQWSALRAAEAQGAALARQAKCLIAEPLDAMLDLPLDEVRQQLQINLGE